MLQNSIQIISEKMLMFMWVQISEKTSCAQKIVFGILVQLLIKMNIFSKNYW